MALRSMWIRNLKYTSTVKFKCRMRFWDVSLAWSVSIAIVLGLYKHFVHIILIITIVIREVFFSMCVKSFVYFSIGVAFIAVVQMGIQMREWEV